MPRGRENKKRILQNNQDTPQSRESHTRQSQRPCEERKEMSNYSAVDRYHHEAGKGSIPRAVDHDKYKTNYDRIFGKKEITNDTTTNSRVQDSQESQQAST